MRGGVEKKMKFVTKLRRNAKAISPIFATLILIAIAVIAGIVVYMFTSGTIASLTGGGTAGQGKLAVQAVDATTPASLVVWGKSTGGTDVVIDGAVIKDSGGQTLQVVVLTPVTFLADGTMNSVTVANTAVGTTGSYTVTLTSQGGGSFVSAAFQP
jgi:flagellin-like protein